MTAATLDSEYARGVDEVTRWLRTATNDQLESLWQAHHERCFPGDSEDDRPWEDLLADPVWRIEVAFRDLIVGELQRRSDILTAAEAGMQGGHLVWVGHGNQVDKFSAICDPQPPGTFCWRGPDRDTAEEALADGRDHHPGHEPEYIL